MSEENKAAESVGIKETKELIAGMEAVGVCVAQIEKDHKIDMTDAAHLVELGGKFNILKDAFSGIGSISSEIKDLNEAEIMELGVAVFTAVKNIKAAAV